MVETIAAGGTARSDIRSSVGSLRGLFVLCAIDKTDDIGKRGWLVWPWREYTVAITARHVAYPGHRTALARRRPPRRGLRVYYNSLTDDASDLRRHGSTQAAQADAHAKLLSSLAFQRKER
jgi:hypothetical protein